MHRFCGAIAASVLAGAVSAARADGTFNFTAFATDPLTNPTVQVQGPNNSRLTWNSNATLTAHYDTTQPTVKLVFPLGQDLTQNSNFSLSTAFTILPGSVVSPLDFGGQAVSFGLVNAVTTGSSRASTGYYDSHGYFVEVTPGSSYDLLTMDYYPTQDKTYGGDSVDLTAIQGAQNGVGFDSSFLYGANSYAGSTLPAGQLLTATLAYSAATHVATLNLSSGISLSADLTGAAFDVNSFAITLWQDPNLNPDAPALAAGHPVSATVIFGTPLAGAPEPSSLALLACAALLLPLRRHRRAGAAARASL